jgi:kumamolisin
LAGVVSEFFPGYQRYVASKDIPGPAPAVNNAARERARDMAPRSIWQPDPQPWPTNTGSPLGPACSANAVTQREVLTPSQIRGAYGIETLDRRGYRGSTARVAIISPNGGFSPADLSAFADCFDLPRQKVDVALGTGVGTPFVSWAVEASLDLQVVAGALAGRGEARIVQTINDIFLLGYIDGFTRALADPAGPPDAASVSYYWCEENYVQRVQVGQRGRMTPMFPVLEDVFAMAGIVGTSLLVASGDAGSGTCQLFGESSLPQPTAAYPASSPFMTAVGGTRLVLGPGNRRVSEVVWNDSPFNQPLASSGGLSNLFTAPWYQRGGLVWQQRAFPDIAALASTQPAYPVFVNGVLSSIGGTSGAAPLMAASFARISAFERSRGRPPIGFVNPWLYSLPKSTFLDITQGDNQLKFTLEGGAFNTPACCAATPGYDLATGHGVLKLPQAVALLPPPEGR